MVFQEPMMSLNPALKIGFQMAEAMKLHTDLSDEEIQERSLEMLRRVRITDPERCLDSYAHEFSGGMRQRIMLASVMMMKPELLIADEPTTALDVLIQKEVMDIMLEVARDLGTSVLLITHDLGLVGRYADHVAVMCRGDLVEYGDVKSVLLTPRSEYTKTLLNSLPTRAGAIKQNSSEQPCPLIEVKGLKVHFSGTSFLPWSRHETVKAVDDVSFKIARGETVSVVGESGSGKTTLGRAILGLIAKTAGQVFLDGKDITNMSRTEMRHLRRRMQIIFQDPYSSLDPRMRIEELIGEGQRNLTKLTWEQKQQNICQVMQDVGLDVAYGDRFPHELSGGQRQRVCIARAIISRPEFIVADEPVSALDVTVQAQILKLLKNLQKKYAFTFMFISHDLGVVEEISDQVIVMYRGKIVEMGTRDDIFDRPHHPYTCRLMEAVPELSRTTKGGYELRQRKVRPITPPVGTTYDNRGAVEDWPITAVPARLVAVSESHRVAICDRGVSGL